MPNGNAADQIVKQLSDEAPFFVLGSYIWAGNMCDAVMNG